MKNGFKYDLLRGKGGARTKSINLRSWLGCNGRSVFFWTFLGTPDRRNEAPYAPKDDMYWIAQDMLIKAIGGAQVKKAIAARQKQVKDKLDTACGR